MTALPPQPLSPLDGRYRPAVAALADYLSEAGLNRARVEVEVEWLIALTDRSLFGSSPVSEADSRRELLFCLLGGHGVSYELSLSAADVLINKGIFGECERRGDRLQRFVQDLLTRPSFEPRRRDGMPRLVAEIGPVERR